MLHRRWALAVVVLAACCCATETFLSKAVAAPPAKAKSRDIDVLIGYADWPTENDGLRIQGEGGKVKRAYRHIPAIAARIPEHAQQALLKNPNVLLIEADGDVELHDAEMDYTWGVKKIGADPVHQSGLLGQGVKVAVIDSGIDYTHPDLIASYAGGYDFVNKDNDPRDDRGHGTHVAGTICAAKNGYGVVGVAPEVRLYALKVFPASGSAKWSDIIAAVDWCVTNQMQVTNNSYGSSSHPGTIVQAAFDRAEAAGIVMVASAGNSGTSSGTGDNVGYPGRFNSVIAVAATDSNDNRGSFSSTGPAVEIAAPGVSVVSTVIGGGYQYWNGTSMASPHVAGAAASLLAAGVPDLNGDGFVDDDVRLLLQAGALDLGATGRDTLFGFGRLDLQTSMLLKGDVPGEEPPAEEPPAEEPPAEEPPAEEPPAEEPPAEEPPAEEPPAEEPPAEEPPAPKSMSVSSIRYVTFGGKANSKHFDVIVKITSEGAAVPGAAVSVEIKNTNRGTIIRSSGTTGSNGEVTFSVKNAASGTWTTSVTSATASGYLWDGSNPANTFSLK